MLTSKCSAVLALGVLGCLVVDPVEAQLSRMWDNMTNPEVSIEIEHPPALPLRVTRIAFGESKGPCADSLQSRLLDDFVSNGVEVLDRSQLDAVIAEHRMQASALFDQKAAAEVGRLLGAQALLYLEVHSCSADRSQSQVKSFVSSEVKIKFHVNGVVRGALKTIDLTTGRVMTAKRFEGKYTETADGGYPASDPVRERAEQLAADQIHNLFFPWRETKTLVFYDDKDCNLKAAHGLLRALDFAGARAQSEQNLEACKAAPATKPKLLAHAHYNLGLVQFLLQDYEPAVQNLSEAARLNSSETVSTALAECRKAQQIAEEMARYETDQAAFLATVGSGASPEPAKPEARAATSAKGAGKSPAAETAPAAGGKGSPEERLLKVENLFKKGLITKAEYDSMRASILSEL